jgi:hypothetical protein
MYRQADRDLGAEIFRIERWEHRRALEMTRRRSHKQATYRFNRELLNLCKSWRAFSIARTSGLLLPRFASATSRANRISSAVPIRSASLALLVSSMAAACEASQRNRLGCKSAPVDKEWLCFLIEVAPVEFPQSSNTWNLKKFRNANKSGEPIDKKQLRHNVTRACIGKLGIVGSPFDRRCVAS